MNKAIARLKLFLYTFVCRYNNHKLKIPIEELIKKYSSYHKEWSKIDKSKDDSFSARDFKFWVYLRENNRIGEKLMLSQRYE